MGRQLTQGRSSHLSTIAARLAFVAGDVALRSICQPELHLRSSSNHGNRAVRRHGEFSREPYGMRDHAEGRLEMAWCRERPTAQRG